MDRSAVWAGPVHRCMLVLTCLLLLCEVMAGCLCNSLINMVDSFHTLYVLIHMIISIRGSKENSSISAGPQDEACPDAGADGFQYVRTRVRPVGGLISALLLSSLCVSIGFHILGHVLQPHALQHPLLATAVGAVSLLFNLLLLVWRRRRQTDTGVTEHRTGETEAPLTPAGSPDDDVLMFCNNRVSTVLHPDSQDRRIHPKPKSISHDSTHTGTVRGEAQRSSGGSGHGAAQQRDVSVCIRSIITAFQSLLGSALVLLNGLLHLHCASFPWSCDVIVYLDPGFSVLTVLVLLAVMVPELRRHVLLLLQASPPGLCTDELTVAIGRVPGVLAVHELHVWQLTETCVVASVHVHCSSGLGTRECSHLLRSITEVLRRFGVKRWTVQPEFPTSLPQDASFRSGCTLRCGKACVRKMCCLPPEERLSSTSVLAQNKDTIILNTHF
ncbi:calcium/manganese antiporter SLC30A10 [Clarias gariepinus]